MDAKTGAILATYSSREAPAGLGEGAEFGCDLALCDLDGDGVLEVAVGARSRTGSLIALDDR